MDLDNDLLSKNVLFKAESILNSNSIEEYNYKLKIHNLKKQNRALMNENKRLRKNLQKSKKLVEENKMLKEYLSKSKKLNRDILNSRSWKITEPLRKLKRML